MAIATVKSTYSLDVATVQRLEHLAALWETSKSAALRRAVLIASEQTQPTGGDKLRALKALQERLALDAREVAQWRSEVTRERHGGSDRRLHRLSR